MTADPADLVSFGLLGVVEVPPYLAVHPEPAGGTEISGEPEGGTRKGRCSRPCGLSWMPIDTACWPPRSDPAAFRLPGSTVG